MNSFVKKYENLILLIVSSLLFGFNNSFFCWFVFLPVLILVNNVNLKYEWLWGGCYGFLSYFFYATWLFNYSFIALLAVCICYFLYWAVLFIVLKLVILKFSDFDVFILPVVLIIYEYLKTVGYAGFNYGINGYSLYKNLFFIQTADFAGVFGVSFILDFCSVVLFKLLMGSKEKNFLAVRISSGLLTVFVVFSIAYGILKVNHFEKVEKAGEKITVCAVQHNTDPWKGGFDYYKKDVESLIELSQKAIEENPEVKIIIWPETSVVPSILKNYNNQKDMKRFELISSLLEFIENSGKTFVIGNYDDRGEEYFNSVFVFESGKNVLPPEPLVYSKIHLVPFSEYFPYEKSFPFIYKLLLEGDTHLWSPGNEYTVFEAEGVKFSTPVCFEDTFGSEIKRFRKTGAEAFFNLSNDAWSKSRRCQQQHLSMAVFRSVENRVPSVRSTASGETCIINRYGKIQQRCKSFTKDYVCGQIALESKIR